MENIRRYYTQLARQAAYVIALLSLVACQPVHSKEADSTPEDSKKQKIMLALLLDTSNSMDGLIEQAKSQLWKIVNELAAAKCTDGTPPEITIALYEYGNDRLSPEGGYIRQVSPLTSDLDVISEKLFSLTTNGGSEYCGYVIRTSLQQLEWSTKDTDLRMIFIAGNEPFTQGTVPYTVACKLAKEKDVVINSIFCGNFNEGIETGWKRGADMADGTYMSIEQNRRTVYVPSPYDDRIEVLNDQLNDTYVYYGDGGEYRKDQQRVQDNNAEHYGKANKVERAISKSSHAYKNSTWDLVDASKDNEKVLSDVRTEDLPAQMRSMTVEQRKTYIKEKAAARQQVKAEIQKLNLERKKFLDSQPSNGQADASLDAAMLQAVKTRAKAKQLNWNKP